MGRMTRLGAMLVAAMMLAAGPLAAEEALFPASFEAPYTGNLTIELFPADGGSRIHRDRGEAEVSFARQPDGAVRFTTRGNVDDSGGFEVSVLLTQHEAGMWRSLSPEGMVQLDGNGRLLSISHSDGFELIWSGQIDQEAASLTFRRIPTASAPAAERDITAVFSLEVERPRPEPAPVPEPVEAETQASEGDGGCARIEWRLVNRWNPWGGGLSLEREPHCVP